MYGNVWSESEGNRKLSWVRLGGDEVKLTDRSRMTSLQSGPAAFCPLGRNGLGRVKTANWSPGPVAMRDGVVGPETGGAPGGSSAGCGACCNPTSNMTTSSRVSELLQAVLSCGLLVDCSSDAFGSTECDTPAPIITSDVSGSAAHLISGATSSSATATAIESPCELPRVLECVRACNNLLRLEGLSLGASDKSDSSESPSLLLSTSPVAAALN